MLDVSDLSLSFRSGGKEIRALECVGFKVESGEFFTLVGPSGCGKSTTLRALAGLARPKSGRITMGDSVVVDVEQGIFTPANRRSIGMVFQSYAIWPHMSVYENVAFPLQVGGRRRKAEVRDAVERSLEVVGLADYGQRSATQLSGGQQQRVALARAIVCEPDVLLLDEPLSNLDAQLRGVMRKELKDLQERIGITTVYVTHDQEEALALSDRMVVMRDGVIAQRGTPLEIYRTPASRFVADFIGATNFLAGTIASGRVEAGINTVETEMGPVGAVSDRSFAAESVLVSMRPEAAVLDPREGGERADVGGTSGSKRMNVLLGEVVSVVFLGRSVECEVRESATGDIFRVASTFSTAPVVGDPVRLSIAAEECVIVPGPG